MSPACSALLEDCLCPPLHALWSSSLMPSRSSSVIAPSARGSWSTLSMVERERVHSTHAILRFFLMRPSSFQKRSYAGLESSDRIPWYSWQSRPLPAPAIGEAASGRASSPIPSRLLTLSLLSFIWYEPAKMLLDQKPQRCCALLMPWHCLMQKFGQIFSARGFEPACYRFRAG